MRCWQNKLAGLGLALALLGCQPRPRFKVQVTDISQQTQSLLASLWLANPPSLPGVLNSGYTDLLEEQPASDFSQFTLPDCVAGDSACAQDKRTFSFGLDYVNDPNVSRSAALVGVAGVTSSGCLSNVRTEAIINPSLVGTPDTLSISFLHDVVDTRTCVSSRYVITDLSLQRDVGANGAEISLLFVDGWGFKPDATLTVSDGCMSYKIGRAGQPSPFSIISVTPTQIVANLGNIDIYRPACGGMTRSVIVTSNQKDTDPFTFK